MYNIPVSSYIKEIYERRDKDVEKITQSVLDAYKIQPTLNIYELEEDDEIEINDRSYEAVKNLSWSQCMYPNAVTLIKMI